MIRSAQRVPYVISSSDIHRIARSIRRYEIISRYTHGTIKRRAMAMINLYIKQFAHPSHAHDMHAAM